MRYFAENGGQYVYRPASASRTGRIVTFALVFSAFITIAIAAVIYLLMRRSGNTEQIYIVPVILFMVLPMDVLLIVLLRKRFSGSGTVSVDYMGGTLRSSEGELSTADVERLELHGPGSPAASGSFAGIVYRILAVSPASTLSVARLGSREEALRVAEELASILSVGLRDLT
ncbi:MAG: hypothetical protein AVO35_04855 [Candidatus Aegiribacteria sp. MLS_C]|nr:MAG: hypothetical protein AVO35_04855 [Candidatus Aegiribacteria sp. MLS_C]